MVGDLEDSHKFIRKEFFSTIERGKVTAYLQKELKQHLPHANENMQKKLHRHFMKKQLESQTRKIELNQNQFYEDQKFKETMRGLKRVEIHEKNNLRRAVLSEEGRGEKDIPFSIKANLTQNIESVKSPMRRTMEHPFSTSSRDRPESLSLARLYEEGMKHQADKLNVLTEKNKFSGKISEQSFQFPLSNLARPSQQEQTMNSATNKARPLSAAYHTLQNTLKQSIPELMTQEKEKQVQIQVEDQFNSQRQSQQVQSAFKSTKNKQLNRIYSATRASTDSSKTFSTASLQNLFKSNQLKFQNAINQQKSVQQPNRGILGSKLYANKYKLGKQSMLIKKPNEQMTKKGKIESVLSVQINEESKEILVQQRSERKLKSRNSIMN